MRSDFPFCCTQLFHWTYKNTVVFGQLDNGQYRDVILEKREVLKVSFKTTGFLPIGAFQTVTWENSLNYSILPAGEKRQEQGLGAADIAESSRVFEYEAVHI